MFGNPDLNLSESCNKQQTSLSLNKFQIVKVIKKISSKKKKKVP